MAKRKNSAITHKSHGVIEGAGEVINQNIDETLEKNYMPYAMSVIMSRALPEIDGFKPSHRKLLYTMYKMGLLNSVRTKSANIVGQTMKLNPHGDSAIYDTMVRLSRGYEALLHPYVDSKGNFGKFYSRDMAWAASRYTEAKLDKICQELFNDIDKNTVDFVDNYDNTLKEPALLPAAFPSILVNANTGIAVGMASSICPFNLKEVCETAIALIKNPKHDVSKTLLAPDFPCGGHIIYDEETIERIYDTGKGSIRVRAKYTYDKSANCIDIMAIPPTTTSEAIIEKIIDLVKQGKVREIADIRDETGLDGLKITIDLKRSVDPDKLMLKLFKMTTLEDSFSCNFNVLISGVPKVLGVKQILKEWISFRTECVRRRTQFDLDKKQKKLHLLYALEKILMDIDKSVSIIKDTNEEDLVIPNLMQGFSIDEVQAEYVSELKLRYLNREYILKRIDEIKDLEAEVKELNSVLSDDSLLKHIIVSELRRIMTTYGKPRRSMLIRSSEIENFDVSDSVPDYPVTVFLSQEGYLKKITPQSLRMSSEQKLKDDDKIIQTIEAKNSSEVLFFTSKAQVYKVKLCDFKDTKASTLGEYVPAKLFMEENENIVSMVITNDYSGNLLFFYKNGNVTKVELNSYKTKTNRRKLTKACCDKFELFSVMHELSDSEYIMKSSANRFLLINSADLLIKTTRSSQGMSVLKMKRGQVLNLVVPFEESKIKNAERLKANNLPSAGFLLRSNNEFEQLQIL